MEVAVEQEVGWLLDRTKIIELTAVLQPLLRRR